MDFFEAQHQARRLTFRLLGLFLISLLTLLVITNGLIMVTLGLLGQDEQGGVTLKAEPGIVIGVSAAVLAVVVLAMLYKTLSLRRGGAAVAEMLQGRLLVDGSQSVTEQRLLNVVEEMAIASGTPVPPVYLIEEPGINAFAAGHTVSDAVIGITRGAIEQLNREELQGVIAHEFSHILHGDMRLNIRLISLLHGIMVLGMAGYYLLRSGAGFRRSRNGNGIVILALGLIVIGATGSFFGNLIKAAVSRQREYLADASAVQYTRSTTGIAGALKRIGAAAEGSMMRNPAASEISHSLFGAGSRLSLRGLFATHPPLEARIRKLEPNWNGEFEVSRTVEVDPPGQGTAADSAEQTGQGSDTSRLGLLAAVAAAYRRTGNPNDVDMSQAGEIHQNLPAELLQAAREPCGARALIYLMLMSDRGDDHRVQLALLEERLQKEAIDKTVVEQLYRLWSSQGKLEAIHRLPLINIALASLRQLSEPQYQLFMDNMALLASSPTPHLNNWLVHNLVKHNLERSFGNAPDHRLTRSQVSLSRQAQPVSVLFSLIIHLSDRHGVAAEEDFAAAVAGLPLSGASLVPAEELSLESLDNAVTQLCRVRAAEAEQLLKAMVVCIEQDGQVSTTEKELLRMLTEMLDRPLPVAW